MNEITPRTGMLFVLVGALASAGANPQRPSRHSGERLTLSVSSPRAQIATCEPLVLDITLRNEGGSPQEVERLFALTRLFVHITNPAGSTLRFVHTWKVSGPREPITLRPGEAVRHRAILMYGLLLSRDASLEHGYVFQAPGAYTLRVAYPVSGEERVEAPPLTVCVTDPQDRERKALELFHGQRQARCIDWPRRSQPPEELVRLSRLYPDTVYGLYARFYLARTVLDGEFDWEEARQTFAAELAGLDRVKAERRLFEKLFEKTASEFADLARSEPAFPLADQCLFYQADCYLSSPADRRSEAVKVLEDLVAKYPESPVAVEARKRLEKLGKNPPAPTTQPSSP